VRHCRDVKVIGWRAEPEWRTAIANIVIQYCNIILIHMCISEFGTVSCVFVKVVWHWRFRFSTSLCG
jgi:hypothetical protein